MRIASLDYLRGLAALAIMAYHYAVWTLGAFGSETILGKVGIYGVSIFYVLSGMTMFLVYKDKLQTNTLSSYIVKRVARIFPLLWLSIFLTIFLLAKIYPADKIMLNLTGLFGFVAPDKYIPTGAWSIGNELVFYAVFPLAVILRRRVKFLLEGSFVVSLMTAIYFCFCLMPNFESLGPAWKTYIHPFNQLFLFLGGVLIAKYLNQYRGFWPALIGISAGLLIFIPALARGDLLQIISKTNRLIYGTGCFLLCAGTLIFPVKKGHIFHRPLKLFGDASYSIYLIHPIIYWFLIDHFPDGEQNIGFLIIAVITTLTLSFFSYFLMEKRIIEMGRRLASKIKTIKFINLLRPIALSFIAVILIFQANKRNEQIERQKLFKNQLESAQTPYSQILAQRCVYRDSVYRVYIANVENVNKLIFLASDSLTPMQKESNFFVHLYPKDKGLLPDNSTHLSFNFKNQPKEFRIKSRKYFYSAKTLPDFEVEKLNLGQYGFRGNNDINWKTDKLLLAEDIAKILKDNGQEMPIFHFTSNNF